MGPRFAGGNLDRNLALVEELRRVAGELGITVAQAAIAWVASRGDDIVPVVGARSRNRLRESVGAVSVVLTNDQLDRIGAAMPAADVAGDRYPAAHMAVLDSER
jgi:aryl-alcohol dehydrogenase-like predicted oxidoreductase